MEQNITAKKGRGIWQRRSRPSSFPLLFGVVSLFLVQKGAKLIPVRSFAEPSGKKIVVFPVIVII